MAGYGSARYGEPWTAHLFERGGQLPDGGNAVRTRVRAIIRDHARLPVDVETIDDEADLYQAGMTSHASVNLMLALESAFDVEFPDAMLTRGVFESVRTISDALDTLGVQAA
jgi:acyl carrier protein